ncbi:MAG: serine protease [Actinomycetota bacterium]
MRTSALAAAVLAALALVTGCGLIDNTAATSSGPTSDGGGAGGSDPVAGTVRLDISSCLENQDVIAGGVFVAPDLVATVAHSFATTRRIDVVGTDGRSQPGRLVWIDTERDLALVTVRGPVDDWLGLGDAEDGSDAEVIVIDLDEEVVAKPARIVRHVTASLDGEGARAAIEIEAEIVKGDSGAPLITEDGAVAGIVFARVRGEDRGWVIGSSEIGRALDALGTEDAEPLEFSC